MHSDLSLHLHTKECQKVIIAYFDCHQENPVKKFFGACNEFDLALRRCLRKERLAKMEVKKKRNEEKQQFKANTVSS